MTSKNRISAFFIIAALIFSLCACNNNTTRAVNESTVKTILGTELVIPENAANTVYFAYETDSYDIGEARFSISGIDYTLRAAKTDSYTDVSQTKLAYDHNSSAVIGGDSVELRYFPGKQGVALWYDDELGISYSLFMNAGATQELLTSAARRCRHDSSELSPGLSEGEYSYANGVYIKETDDAVYFVAGAPKEANLLDSAWRMQFASSVCEEKTAVGKTCYVFLVTALDDSGKVDFETKKLQTIVKVTFKNGETSSASYTGNFSLADIIKQQ